MKDSRTLEISLTLLCLRAEKHSWWSIQSSPRESSWLSASEIWQRFVASTRCSHIFSCLLLHSREFFSCPSATSPRAGMSTLCLRARVVNLWIVSPLSHDCWESQSPYDPRKISANAAIWECILRVAQESTTMTHFCRIYQIGIPVHRVGDDSPRSTRPHDMYFVRTPSNESNYLHYIVLIHHINVVIHLSW